MKKTINNTYPIKINLRGSNLLFSGAEHMKHYYEFNHIENFSRKELTNDLPSVNVILDKGFVKEIIKQNKNGGR